MCINESGKLKLFNKDITEAKFNEVYNAINSLVAGWFPKFNDAFELYDKVGQVWEKVPAPNIKAVAAKEAYKDMPNDLIEYFKSLPEYDKDIFNEITGGLDV